MANPQVKVVNIRYGVLKKPHTKNIEKTIQKWLSQGYRLEDQQEVPPGCLGTGTTRLTFMKDS